MGDYIKDNNLLVTETRTFQFHFDLSKGVDKGLKHETDSIIRRNEFFSQRKNKKQN